MSYTTRLLRGLGPDILKAGARNIISRATPFIANKLLDASNLFKKHGYDTSNIVDKSINFLTSNQDKLKKMALNAIKKDMEVNLRPEFGYVKGNLVNTGM